MRVSSSSWTSGTTQLERWDGAKLDRCSRMVVCVAAGVVFTRPLSVVVSPVSTSKSESISTGAPLVAVKMAGPPAAAARADTPEVDRVIRPEVLTGGRHCTRVFGGFGCRRGYRGTDWERFLKRPYGFGPLIWRGRNFR